MIKRSTWLFLALLVVVVAAYLVLKNLPGKAGQATPTPSGSTYLITKSDGALQSLSIVDAHGNSFRMQRDPSKVWVITAPSVGEADQGPAGAAESQVGAISIISMLDAPADLGSFQLGTPAYTIDVTFDSGKQHKIEVGAITPTSSGYYVRFDSQKFYVVSQNEIDPLVNLLKAPPFPPTSTPVDTLTPAADTETPTPSADFTPANASPTP